MDKTEIFNEVKLILEHRGFRGAVYGSNLASDLGMDSLDIIEFSFDVEAAFSIEIPDHELDKLDTVCKMVEYIEKEESDD